MEITIEQIKELYEFVGTGACSIYNESQELLPQLFFVTFAGTADKKLKVGMVDPRMCQMFMRNGMTKDLMMDFIRRALTDPASDVHAIVQTCEMWLVDNRSAEELEEIKAGGQSLEHVAGRKEGIMIAIHTANKTYVQNSVIKEVDGKKHVELVSLRFDYDAIGRMIINESEKTTH